LLQLAHTFRLILSRNVPTENGFLEFAFHMMKVRCVEENPHLIWLVGVRILLQD
jgi:hypothetical protein